MTPNEVNDFLRQDPWFDSKDYAWIVYGIARALARVFGFCLALEIGVREGSLSIPLLAGIRAGGKGLLVSVDNDTDSGGHVRVAQERVERYGLAELWEFHLADSRTWESPYSNYRLILIDGDHAYPTVKSDFTRFTPLLAKHGLVLMHDAETFVDVRRYVAELDLTEWQASVLPFNNGLAVVRRRADWLEGLRYNETFVWEAA